MVLHEISLRTGKSFKHGASAEALASFVWSPVAIKININEKKPPYLLWLHKRIIYFGKLVIELPFINYSRQPCVSNGVISI